MSGDLEQTSLLLPPEPEANVHSFGVLMLEIISGKLSFSDEYGSIEQWVYFILFQQRTTENIISYTKGLVYVSGIKVP